jgi:AraC-like DNA-binding protein
MSGAIARYCEYAPCEALREHVSAFFSFTMPPGNGPARRLITREVLFQPGDPFWSALFADGHVSMVFSFGAGYRVEGLWDPRPAGFRGHLIGPISAVRATSAGKHLVQAGAYFRAGQARLFTGMFPADELSDRIVAMEDLWGNACSGLETELGEANGDEERVSILESALLRRMSKGRNPNGALDVTGLAAHVLRRRGQVTVESLGEAAGVSRQHLTRAFREAVGVTPKLYCRLARFKAALAYPAPSEEGGWAQAALEMGYADQSHMIAEFREFSGLTPAALAHRRTFHPFIERLPRGAR